MVRECKMTKRVVIRILAVVFSLVAFHIGSPCSTKGEEEFRRNTQISRVTFYQNIKISFNNILKVSERCNQLQPRNTATLHYHATHSIKTHRASTRAEGQSSRSPRSLGPGGWENRWCRQNERES